MEKLREFSQEEMATWSGIQMYEYLIERDLVDENGTVIDEKAAAVIADWGKDAPKERYLYVDGHLYTEDEYRMLYPDSCQEES